MSKEEQRKALIAAYAAKQTNANAHRTPKPTYTYPVVVKPIEKAPPYDPTIDREERLKKEIAAILAKPKRPIVSDRYPKLVEMAKRARESTKR